MLLYYYIIIHRLRPPTATALDPGSHWPIDGLGDWRAEDGTFLKPKWHQNGTKMAPRWPLGGSWGLLGGKMAPRWSQEGFKVKKVNSFPPCWGPSWDPILDTLMTGVDYKRLQEALGWHVALRHQFLSENGPLGTALDMKNQAKPLEGCQKSRFPFRHVKLL